MPYGSGYGVQFNTYRNVMVNGDMAINQINTLGSGTAVNMGVAASPAWNNTDVFGLSFSGAPAVTVSDFQASDHPILGTNGNGFAKAVNVTAALAAVGAAQQASIFGTVDATLIEAIYTQQCALSFQVKSPKVGQHYVTLITGSGNFETYTIPFMVDQANAWEQKILGFIFNPPAAAVTFVPEDAGISVVFPLAAGANFQTALLEQWVVAGGAPKIAGAGQQNLLDTIGNEFMVTDVQIEPGFVATAFDRVNFPESLLRCLRYFYSTFTYGTTPKTNIGNSKGALAYNVHVAGVFNEGLRIVHPVEMPNWPTITFYNPNAANAKWRNLTGGADSGAASETAALRQGKGTFVVNPQVAGDTAGRTCAIHYSADYRSVALFPNI